MDDFAYRNDEKYYIQESPSAHGSVRKIQNNKEPAVIRIKKK